MLPRRRAGCPCHDREVAGITPATDDPEALDAIRAGLWEANARASLLLADFYAGKREILPMAFVAREGGAIIGGVTGEAHPAFGWAHIHRLWVAEDHRGQGLGTRLMRAIEDEARRLGCRHARVETLTVQAPAFYTGLGYVEYGHLEASIPAFGGEEPIAELFLRRDL